MAHRALKDVRMTHFIVRSASSPPKVLIYQSRLFHYRVPFFQKLRDAARDAGIDLNLVHGTAAGFEQSRQDEGFLDWAVCCKTHHFRFRDVDLIWHETPPHLIDPAMIILMQENRILSNYPHLLRLRRARPLLALWGHGRNFQTNAPDGFRERWKQFYLPLVDYWFAYTSVTARVLADARFPQDRICVLQNTIDTREFITQCEAVDDDAVGRLRAELGIPSGAPVGLFCGSLYPNKRLDLLFASADIVKRQVPNFHLVIVGTGPNLGVVQDAVGRRPWARSVGSQRGPSKAAFFKMAAALLNPGAIGLGVLDGFSAGLATVTTRIAAHGPEIAYLEDGVNALITSSTPGDYAAAVVRLLLNSQFQREISEAARKSASLYSLDVMTSNFMAGIMNCFHLGPLRVADRRAAQHAAVMLDQDGH